MLLRKYKYYIKKAIRLLKAPNEFELLEFFKYSNMRLQFPNVELFSIRYYLNCLLHEKVIVECETKSKQYPRRYCLPARKPYCKLEPAILKKFSHNYLIKEAKDVLKNGRHSLYDFEFIPDPYRNIVIAVMNNSLIGVIDLRYHRPENDIRLPMHFYKRYINHQIIPGMTELQYFSRLINNQNISSPNGWLNIRCLGYSICN